MKSFLKAAAATGIAAATVLTGLSFGPAATAAPSVTADFEAGDTGAPLQLIAKESDTEYRYVTSSGVTVTAPDLATAKKSAITLTPTWASVPNLGEGWTLRTDDGRCYRPSGWTGTVWSVQLWNYDCDRYWWSLDEGWLKYNVPNLEPGWLTTTLNQSQDLVLKAGRPTGSSPFVGLPGYLGYALSADVADVDVEAGTAKFVNGSAPDDVTNVEVSYTDKDGKQVVKDEAVADGTWSSSLRNLALGKTTVHLVAYDGGDAVAESDVTVDLPVTPLTATGSFASAIDEVATISGTGTPNTQITVKHGEKDVAMTTSDADGKYSVPVNAPNTAGTYDLTVTQKIRGEDATPQEVSLDYGIGVSITSPGDDHVLDPGDQLVVTGAAQSGSAVKVYEKGKPDTVLATVVAGTSNTYRAVLRNLEDRQYELVVEGLSKGYNRTTAEVTINPGKSTVAPLVISSPADGSVTENPTKTVQFSGTAEPGARVQIRTQGSSPRMVVDTTAAADGTWSDSGDLAFDVAYTLDTIYTAPGEAPLTGVYHVTNTPSVTTVDSDVVTPAEDAVVVAPNKEVTVSGTATTGTQVTIWNWKGKDRQVAATVTADAAGKWETVATLNNQNSQYALFVEYTKNGTTTTQTRNITVVDKDSTTKPFSVDTPAEGATVVSADKQVQIAGQGTTGTKVEIWNWKGKDRKVAATAYVDASGKWETTATLNNQNTAYDLFVEYTVPGGTVMTTTRNITVVDKDSTTKPFSVDTPAEGATVVSADKQVQIAGQGTTGTKVEIWNWKGKDRKVAATAYVDASGKWETTATLNNQNTAYDLFVEYTVPGGTLQTATRSITVASSAGVTKEFAITDPVSGSTSAGHTPGQPATITWNGTGAAGATVEIWTESRSRRVNESPIVVQQDGTWTGSGNLSVQPGYKLHFDYTLDGETVTTDYTIDVTA